MADGVIALPDGEPLQYNESGRAAGPAVLLLHGLGHAAGSWRHQLADPALGSCRLVAVDLRGHGRSGWKATDTFDRATWAGDLEVVIDGLELAPVTIVAWSYAGLVLADYLGVHGTSKVRAINLVAAATRAGFPDAYADFGSGALPGGFLDDDPAVAHAADAKFILESMGATPFAAEDARELQAIVGGTSREVLRRLLRREADNGPQWRTTDVPVLLTHGTQDRINLPLISERQLRTIPGARISRYEGAGHLPFWEDPARFDRDLLELVATAR